MRAIYETKQDIQRERSVAEKLAELWQAQARHLPRLYPVDVAMLRNGRVVAFLEIKNRTRPYTDFSRFYRISLHKYVEMTKLKATTDLPVLLVVRFGCGTIAYRQTELNDKPTVVYSGRVDRNDPADLEPHVELPIKDFIVLDTTN